MVELLARTIRRGGAVGLLVVASMAGAVAQSAPEAPIALVLALDTSGSLQAEEQARRGVLVEEVLAQLPAGSRVAVFGFNDESELILSWTSDLEAVVEATVGLTAAGRHTALHDSIFDASRYLSGAEGQRKAILLVTDGLDENSALTLEDGVDTARELEIPVFTVGLGRVQERVLRRIAKLTDGEHFRSSEDGSQVGSRIVALTPAPAAAPVAADSPAAGGVQVAAGAESAPTVGSTLSRGVFWTGWLIALVLAVGSVIAFALALRRSPSSANGPDDAVRLEPEEDVEGTLVTRLDNVDEAGTTMVLTLKPLLHVTRGPEAGRFFEVSLDSAVSIGRAEANDVVLKDRAVSSQHCRIRPTRNGGFELFDLQSTNGTWVNERRVGRQPLAAGDSIKVGESVMQFRMDHMKGPGED